MEILQLVDQLEQTMNRGWRVPLSPSLIVNSEECLSLIDQMRIRHSQRDQGKRAHDHRAGPHHQRCAGGGPSRSLRMPSSRPSRSLAKTLSPSAHAKRPTASSHMDTPKQSVWLMKPRSTPLTCSTDWRDNLNNSLQQAENGIQAIEASQAPHEETGLEDSVEEFVPPPSLQSDELNDESEDEKR